MKINERTNLFLLTYERASAMHEGHVVRSLARINRPLTSSHIAEQHYFVLLENTS